MDHGESVGCLVVIVDHEYVGVVPLRAELDNVLDIIVGFALDELGIGEDARKLLGEFQRVLQAIERGGDKRRR